MTKQQMAKARRVIKVHYQLRRLPSEMEVKVEIANMQRRKAKGFCDDRWFELFAALRTGPHPIDIFTAC